MTDTEHQHTGPELDTIRLPLHDREEAVQPELIAALAAAIHSRCLECQERLIDAIAADEIVTLAALTIGYGAHDLFVKTMVGQMGVGLDEAVPDATLAKLLPLTASVFRHVRDRPGDLADALAEVRDASMQARRAALDEVCNAWAMVIGSGDIKLMGVGE